MIRKTMRVGEIRTSIKLEGEFWSYLKEVADGRKLRLSALVNEVAEATPRPHQPRLDAPHLLPHARQAALPNARARARPAGARRQTAGSDPRARGLPDAVPDPRRRAGDPPAQPRLRALAQRRPARHRGQASRQHHDPARHRPE